MQPPRVLPRLQPNIYSPLLRNRALRVSRSTPGTGLYNDEGVPARRIFVTLELFMASTIYLLRLEQNRLK